jgi:DNA-binding transcriptional regulator YhcF (GntR family)
MNHVSARIASGELRPGMVIDWNDIATQTGIPVLSMGNSRRALVHEGLICTVRGVGTFVGKEPPADVKPIPPKRVPIQQRKIMNHVSARIASGELRPGMIIDWNDIATRTGAPLASMGKPRRALVREGLICTIRGVGTFVGKEPPADVKPTPPKRVPLQQRKIMNHVLARIASGELKPGMIIDWTGVNADIGAKTRTIARARKALIADGYVSTVRGVGTFVGKEPPTGVKAILSDKNE